MKKIKLPEINPSVVEKEIGDFIVKKVLQMNATGAVIGLSGGVDSTVTAALAKRAFDKYNDEKAGSHGPGLKLIGYILPSNINKSEDVEDALKVIEKLEIRHEFQNLEPIIKAFRTTNKEAFKENYDKGNMISRIRANVLSTKAATEHKIILGTGNKDEDFGIGYYTLFGDGAVHISPIGGLSKRLVKQMAVHLGFPDVAKRTPTAGLELGQTDFGDLGYDYETVELVIEGLNQGFKDMELLWNPQINKQIKKTIKKSKFNNVSDILFDIWLRHKHSALPKGKLIRPETPKITLKYK